MSPGVMGGDFLIASTIRRVVSAVLLLGMLSPVQVQAGRGLLLNGYGSEQLAMGGADVAVARDVHAINNNPAGLAQLREGGWDTYLYGYYAFAGHEDSLGNNEIISQRLGGAFAASYARRLERSPDLVFSVGFYGQGGTGIGYENLATEYGTRDEISSDFGVSKVITGLGWQYGPSLRLGIGVGLAYAMGRQKLFPETSDASDPANPFFGARFDGGDTLRPNAIVGLQWTPSPDWTFGAAYTSRTDVSLSGGTLTVNFDAIGQGRVKYDDAEIKGFALPQEWDLGLAWRIRPDWLIAFEFNWLDYSSALRETVLRAHSPNNPAAPATLEQRTPLYWRDQYVYALGIAHEWDARTRIWAGINKENSPIREETYNPTLNLAQEIGLATGMRRVTAAGWYWTGVIEYQLGSTHRSSTPGIPLGDAREDRYENLLWKFSIGKAW